MAREAFHSLRNCLTNGMNGIYQLALREINIVDKKKYGEGSAVGTRGP